MGDNKSEIAYPADYSKACPVCALNGHLNYIKVFQATDTKAVLACESIESPCNSEFTVFDRHYLDMPVKEDYLESLHLPKTLAQEPHLKLKHINTLIWLNVLKTSIPSIIEHEKQYVQYCKTLESHGITKGAKYINDPDIVNLKKLEEDVVSFGKHIVPGLDVIINDLKDMHAEAGIR